MNLIRILPDYQVGIGFQLYVLERYMTYMYSVIIIVTRTK